MQQDCEYDLMLVENDLPGVSGLELLERLRLFEAQQNISDQEQPFLLFYTPQSEIDDGGKSTRVSFEADSVYTRAVQLGAEVHPKTCPFALLVDLAMAASMERLSPLEQHDPGEVRQTY